MRQYEFKFSFMDLSLVCGVTKAQSDVLFVICNRSVRGLQSCAAWHGKGLACCWWPFSHLYFMSVLICSRTPTKAFTLTFYFKGFEQIDICSSYGLKSDSPESIKTCPSFSQMTLCHGFNSGN